ncbi:hypothetical protein HY522_03270 [bacterium]|nr:hypothetical protein [bacterium]
MRTKMFLVLFALTALMIISAQTPSEAIPAFARKYGTSCSTCHIAPPTLNARGLAFRMNGYRFPDEEEKVKDEPIELGAKSDKRTYPNTIFPSTIPHLPPIALRYFGDFNLRNDAAAVRNNFNAPNFFRLLAGGNLDERISFLATICWKIGMTPATNRFGTFVPFQVQLGFHHLLENQVGRNGLNLRVGMIDVPNLSWNNFFQHLLTTNYLYGQRVGNNTTSFFEASGAQPGVEFNGQLVKNRLWYAAGLVNGDDGGVSDANTSKDGYLTARYKVGGNPYGGEEAFAGAGGGYTVEVGGLLYSGRANVAANVNEDFTRKGGDVRLSYNMDGVVDRGSWTLTAAKLRGDDDNPFNTKKTADYESVYLEGTYVVTPPWLVGGRWEKQDMTTSDAAQANIDKERYVGNVTWRLRHNVKISGEGVVYKKFNGARLAAARNNDYTMRFDVAF